MTRKDGAEVTICAILFTTTGLLFVINKLILSTELFVNPDPEYSWLLHGLQNVIGYSTIFIPGYIIYKYIHKIDYLNNFGGDHCTFILRKCFGEDDSIELTNKTTQSTQKVRTFLHSAFLLLFYFVGLQVSFLTWGVLQEKIMTQNYTNIHGNVDNFKDSQFLVFVNRVLAFYLSGVVVICIRQPRHKSPLYKYVFCSISNILSSWCQYEALKYVSFLHQVLAKSAKTVPVLIMGKIISKTKYEYYEYVTVIGLSCGMLFFMLDTESDRKSSAVTTFSGVILLCAYIFFDSFTSNWQGALFKRYGMSPVQMMCAVNMFSCLFTAVSLLQQDGFVESFNFMLRFPTFTIDCLLLSICSAAGQLFIFKTISNFGPLVFAIITTIRQGLSVMLSCLIYDHHIYALGIFGLILIFLSIFFRIYCVYRIKVVRKHIQNVTK